MTAQGNAQGDEHILPIVRAPTGRNSHSAISPRWGLGRRSPCDLVPGRLPWAVVFRPVGAQCNSRLGLRHSLWSLLCSVSILTPKALHPTAQGCRVAATLGEKDTG